MTHPREPRPCFERDPTMATSIKLPGCALLLALLSWAPRVPAQGNKVAAEALFEEGRRLIAQKNPAQACPKFAESQHLDPSAATLINLASCYERLGKTASAWATYREAASTAAAMNRPTLVPIAQRHAATLEPELARLVITVPTPAEGLEIRRDGTVVRAGEWDVAVPVDPGVLRIEATAPRKKKWSASADASEPGKTVTIAVPLLEDGPPEPTPPGVVSPAAVPAMLPPIVPQPEPQPSRMAPQRTIALVTGGLGVAGLVLGTVFVVNARSKYDDSLAGCPVDNNRCTPEGTSLRDDARRNGNIATVAYGVAGAAIITAVVLWVTAPKAERATQSAEVRVSPAPGGLAMVGRW